MGVFYCIFDEKNDDPADRPLFWLPAHQTPSQAKTRRESTIRIDEYGFTNAFTLDPMHAEAAIAQENGTIGAMIHAGVALNSWSKIPTKKNLIVISLLPQTLQVTAIPANSSMGLVNAFTGTYFCYRKI